MQSTPPPFGIQSKAPLNSLMLHADGSGEVKGEGPWRSGLSLCCDTCEPVFWPQIGASSALDETETFARPQNGSETQALL